MSSTAATDASDPNPAARHMRESEAVKKVADLVRFYVQDKYTLMNTHERIMLKRVEPKTNLSDLGRMVHGFMKIYEDTSYGDAKLFQGLELVRAAMDMLTREQLSKSS